MAAGLPDKVETFYGPFAGSAAMSIYAAQHGLAAHFVVADSLGPMIDLLRAIVATPEATAGRYRELWDGQPAGDDGYFNRVRARYNESGDHVDLLYLICRCVKNSVRFNRSGRFTQSVDKRRLGLRPDKMQRAIHGVSATLRGRVEFRVGDWLNTTADVRPVDFVYMDPPYRPISKTANFNSFYMSPFDDGEQRRLALFYQELGNAGAKLMLSNSDPQNENPHDSFFHDLYAGFSIHKVSASRRINSNGAKRGPITELLIANY